MIILFQYILAIIILSIIICIIKAYIDFIKINAEIEKQVLISEFNSLKRRVSNEIFICYCIDELNKKINITKINIGSEKESMLILHYFNCNLNYKIVVDSLKSGHVSVSLYCDNVFCRNLYTGIPNQLAVKDFVKLI